SEPMTATQIVSRQTWGNTLDHWTHGYDVSTPGLGLTASDFEQVVKLNLSNALSVEYEVLLPGDSGTPVENITLGSAVKIELSCRLDDKYSSMKILQVTWKKGNEIIKHINKTENSWGIQLMISENKDLGSYTCTVKGEEEFSAVFHLQGKFTIEIMYSWFLDIPHIEGGEKPVVSYQGDSAVLICKSYTPIAWTWYMTNGSEQIAIDGSLQLDKYVIDTADRNETHLKILKLTKEDDGAYWCEAAFELGKRKRKLQLTILSLMVPLKPFLAIVAEVVIVIFAIFMFEIYSKKKEKRAEHEKEFDQIEQLKSEETSGVENSARHRRV
ncbi:EMB protein, partial [Alectura lathami]|nr:EMB protein [Alectura lathami]